MLEEDWEDELFGLLLDEIATELDELDLILEDEVVAALEDTPQALTTP